jgi:hypothetical protein
VLREYSCHSPRPPAPPPPPAPPAYTADYKAFIEWKERVTNLTRVCAKFAANFSGNVWMRCVDRCV